MTIAFQIRLCTMIYAAVIGREQMTDSHGQKHYARGGYFRKKNGRAQATDSRTWLLRLVVKGRFKPMAGSSKFMKVEVKLFKNLGPKPGFSSQKPEAGQNGCGPNLGRFICGRPPARRRAGEVDRCCERSKSQIEKFRPPPRRDISRTADKSRPPAIHFLARPCSFGPVPAVG